MGIVPVSVLVQIVNKVINALKVENRVSSEAFRTQGPSYVTIPGHELAIGSPASGSPPSVSGLLLQVDI